MTRRSLLCGLLLASAVLACFAGWLLAPETPTVGPLSGLRVTRDQLEEVTIGMSTEQVIRTVGGPPGNYTNGPISTEACACLHPDQWPLYGHWICDDGHLVVYFDKGGIVQDLMIYEVVCLPKRPTRKEVIRRWLGL
jgi:outer membrane protein assembly factor BamE (lipoprotein component of BamABCDE complex)